MLWSQFLSNILNTYRTNIANPIVFIRVDPKVKGAMLDNFAIWKSKAKSGKISSVGLTIDQECTLIFSRRRFSNEYPPIHTHFTADPIHLHNCTLTQQQWWELKATMPACSSCSYCCIPPSLSRSRTHLCSVLNHLCKQSSRLQQCRYVMYC